MEIRKMKPKYEAVIWDMDGTILDTLEDLHDSTCHILNQNNLPSISIKETRSYLGNGAYHLIEMACPKGTNKETIEKIFEEYKPYYASHCEIKTKPYDGILEVMNTLKAKGIKQAIVSNKPDDAVRILSDKYFTGLADYSIGDSPERNKKPAPDSVFKALEALNVSKEKAVYIGDSEVDLMTAKNSEMDCITVLWGFRDKEDLIEQGASTFADKPNDILEILEL